MKSKLSSFLTDKKIILKEIISDLSKDFKYVSILGVDTFGTVYSVSRSNTSVADSRLCEKGFVARVFNGVNYSEYSFNNLDDTEKIKREIRKLALADIKKYSDQGTKLMELPLIVDEEITMDYASEFAIDPFSISAEEKLARLTKLRDDGLKMSENFIDFRTLFEEVKLSKIFLSNDKDLSQCIVFINMYLVPIGKNEKGIKYDFSTVSGLKGFEAFDEAEKKLKLASDAVLALLDSEPIVPGEYDIICDPSVTGLIAHEAFGHGVEMDMFVKNRAKGTEYIDKYVASELLSMRDGAKSHTEVGTYLFDDEGTIGTDTLVIDKGILKTGISDLLSALQLGTKPTGNGRRESYERKAYARMTNTFFESGNDNLDDMIKSIDNGYLLEGYFSGMEDPKNWGIQCVIAKGKEIVNGEFTGKVVSPITLTGYVPDLLKSITMIAKDPVKLSGTGFCGKGHKELVKNSNGGTFIKAKGVLS